MTKTIVMTGKSGPAFGDRASWVSISALDVMGDPTGEDCAVTSSVTNWPAQDRSDSLRAALDSMATAAPYWGN